MTSSSGQQDGELYRSSNLLEHAESQPINNLIKDESVQISSLMNEVLAADEEAESAKTDLPKSSDAEKSLLCSILIDPDAIETTVQCKIHPNDFAYPAHAALYQAMYELHAENNPINTVTIIDKLTETNKLHLIGSSQSLAQYEYFIDSSAMLQTYIDAVRQKSTFRKLIKTSNKIIRSAYSQTQKADDLLNDAERLILQIRNDLASQDITSIQELVKLAMERITNLYGNKLQLTGISSGFRGFDQITNGLQAGELIIIAARPSMGKTAFTLNIAANVAMNSKDPVAFFSLEMGAEQLVHRLMGSEARLDLSKLRRGQIERNEFSQLITAAGKLGEAPLFIDETASLSISEMRSKSRRYVKNHNVKLIIVDYLQLMNGPEGYESKAVEVAEISKGLKGIARELKVPVIALSQLNRGVESRIDKRPMMSDLRESGAIEQDADVIAFLYREEYYLRDKTPEDKIGIAEVIVAKNRNGPTGVIELRFSGNITRFVDLDRHHEGFSE
jgi:replicative DNA helicase